MTLERRLVEIPRLVHVGDTCLDDAVRLLRDHTFDLGRVYVGSGGERSTKLASRVADTLRAAGSHVVQRTDLTAGAFQEGIGLTDEIDASRSSTIVAVGGGTVIDTLKVAAVRSGAELVSIPTAISHDGISSPVASLRGEDGRRQSYPAMMPAGILLDTTVIGDAPVKTLRAGLGDLVSNLTAITDWRLAADHGEERYDAYSAMIAESAASSVLDLPDLDSHECRERLAKGLLMSGLAMAAAGTSRPCSGAEHLISHSLDQVLGERAALHGEQVALGTLVALVAHRSSLRTTVTDLYRRVDLPMHPSDLEISRADMTRAIQDAPGIRPERHTVLSELSLTPAVVDDLYDQAFDGRP